MNKSTDTPRTDEEMWTTDYHHELCNVVNTEFAQQLEMELAVSLQNQVKAQSEIERLRKENNEFLLSESALSEELKICDDWLRHTRNEVARLRQALELIACPERPDGTYNRGREACELLAKEALKAEIQLTIRTCRPLPKEPANPTCSNITHKFSYCDCDPTQS